MTSVFSESVRVPATRRRIARGSSALAAACLILSSSVSAQTTRYVDREVGGDGTSWCSAYATLQQALAAALPGDTILVADGTYRPSTTGNRNHAFALKNGVTIRGGYAGCGAPDPNARDVVGTPTILSGDLDANDPDLSDNSLHVFHNIDVDATAVLEGFTIRAGRADGSEGGGMRNERSSPTVRDCVFSANGSEGHGGAVYNNDHSSPRFEDCRFEGNQTYGSSHGGGAMASWVHSDPELIRCVFVGNSAGGVGVPGHGGALNNGHSSDPRVFGCSFFANTASSGGGAVWSTGNTTAEYSNCVFVGNRALSGGAFAENGEPALTSCTFVANEAVNLGGALYLHAASLVQTSDCIYWGNVSSESGEPAQIRLATGAGIYIDACLVEGWTGTLYGPATRSSGLDPLFVRAPDPASGDYGDLRLRAGSPGVDSGHNFFAPLDPGRRPVDSFDLDGDGDETEPPPLDRDGNPRFLDSPEPNTGFNGGLGAIIDRGAYEGSVAECAVASAVPRNAGNPVTLSVTTPRLGTTFRATVDLTQTRHTHAVVFCHVGSANAVLGVGVTLLVDRRSPLLFRSPALTGPVGIYDMPIPLEPALCGISGSVQAIHSTAFGRLVRPGFRLSNAFDIVLGI